MRPRSPSASGGLLSGMAAGGWQPCLLTWYDPALGGTNSSSGKPEPHGATASGEAYDPSAMTCAAPSQYSFGTLLTFQYNGQSVTCRVNDRGGAITGSHFDLSRAAANALGIINAGRANAQFMVGGSSGASPAANSAAAGANNANNGSGGSSGGGGPDPLSIISDLLTGNVSDLALTLGEAFFTVVKDAVLAGVDWIVIPWWQWNQRAAQYYWTYEINGKEKDSGDWAVLPWTAAFWGMGYWLFWTDPDNPEGALRPAPVRRSRAARHVRVLQAIPARRELIKPARVDAKTPRKPTPQVSHASVTRVDTMSVTRALPVRVQRTGDNTANGGTRNTSNETRSEIPIERAGTRNGEDARGNENGRTTAPADASQRRDTRRRNTPANGKPRGGTPSDRGGGIAGDTGPRRATRREA